MGMVKKKLKEDPIVAVEVVDVDAVETIDDQDNHAKAVVMPVVVLKLVKLKVQLIDQNDLMLSAEDDRHVVVVEVAAVVVNDVNSIAKVVIQNHLKSHSRKKKVQELVIGELLRTNFKVRQRSHRLRRRNQPGSP